MFAVLFAVLWSVVVLLSSCLVILSAYIAIRRRRVNLPSPPVNSFFFGHAEELKNSDPNVLLAWAHQYGTVYKLFVLHRVIVIVCDHRWIKEILVSGSFPKSELVYKHGVGTLFGTRVLGEGLVSAIDHERWHKHRLLLNPSFHKTFLVNEQLHVFNDYGDRLIEKLRLLSRTQKAVNMYDMFSRITMDIISKAAFGFELGALDNPDVSLLRCIYMFFIGQQISFNDPIGSRVTPKGRKLVEKIRECCNQLRNTGIDCVMNRLQLIENGQPVPKDSLTALIRNYYDEHGKLRSEDLERLVDEFITIFIAGHETTAGTMSFLLWLMSNHADARQKLNAEIDTLLCDTSTVSKEDLDKLPYLSCALKETLRLCPPAPATVRDVTEPTKLFGVDLPVGTLMIVQIFVVQRLPQYFDSPNDFIPERFETDDNRIPCSYMPFSLGPRFCLGKEFAMIEAKVLLAKLLRHFKFELCPDKLFEIEMAGTMKPKNGLYMTLTEK